MQTKHCPGCDRDLPMTREHWWKRAMTKDGLDYYCRDCRQVWKAKSDANRKAKYIPKKRPMHLVGQVEYRISSRVRAIGENICEGCRGPHKLAPGETMSYCQSRVDWGLPVLCEQWDAADILRANGGMREIRHGT